MRTCRDCGQGKPLSAFGKTRAYTTTGGAAREYRRRVCEACRSKPKADWRRRNPGKVRSYSKKWRDANPDKVRDINYRRYYGIGLADYEAMYEAQQGKCLICLDWYPQLVVDHSHSTGEVRGLLCSQCNQALGLLRDSPSLARAAATYLER